MDMHVVDFLLRVGVILHGGNHAWAQVTDITTALILLNDVTTTDDNYIETASNVTDCPNLKFSTYPYNETTTELNVGMKATLRLSLTLPPGSYNLVKLRIARGVKYIDIGYFNCQWGSSVRYASKSTVYVANFGKTGFARKFAYQTSLHLTSVTISDAVGKRQCNCDSDIYFHNADGLMDGQNISVIGRATVQTKSGDAVYENIVVFTARTSVLEINKTAYYELDTGVPSEIFSEFKAVTKMVFRSWMPYYNPRIEVTVNYGNGTLSNTTWAAYLRVLTVANHFKPGAKIDYLTACHFSDLSADHIRLGFPAQWVNRGYYASQNTTDEDLIEFEAGVIILDPVSTWINDEVDIAILLNGTQDWASTISLAANKSISNISKVHLNGTSSRELFPNSATSLVMTISTLKDSADIITINVSTHEITTTNEPALMIDTIRVHEIGANFLCTNFTVTYNHTPVSSIQNLAIVTLHYINIGKDETSNNIMFEIDIKIDTSKAKLGDTHVVSAVLGESVSEYNISFNSPEVWGDDNGTIMSQLNEIFDGNHTTCLHLPVQGAVPPFLWMRIYTSWLNISSTEYTVTVVGMRISCAQHGQRILQVSFPTTNSKEGFHGGVTFCIFIVEDVIPHGNLTKCVYKCQCKNSSECQEMILFMAKQDDILEWSLCELSARKTH